MLPLRYPAVWIGLGWLLVLGVIAGSLLPGHALPTTFGAPDKIKHALAYFLLTVWFAGLYPRSRHFAIGVALFGLGLALDMLQGLTVTRSFEWLDIASNVAGIAAGIALSAWLLEGWCQRLEQRLLS